MATIYQDGSYLTRHPTWHAEDSRWKAAQILKMIRRHSLAPCTVADVGCGAGEVLRQLAESLPGTKLLAGYEISADAHRLCRSRETERVRYFLEDLAARKEVFDLVLVIDVLEHVDDPLFFLRQLKARGRNFLFRIPLDLSLQSRWQPAVLREKRKIYGHLHYFSEATALALLQAAGYDVLDHVLNYGPIDLRRFGAWRSLLMSVKKLAFMIGGQWVTRLLDGFSIIVLAR